MGVEDKTDEPGGQLIEVQFDRGPSAKLRRSNIDEHNARVLAGIEVDKVKRMEELRRRLLTVVSTTPMDGIRLLGLVEDGTPEGWLIADGQLTDEPSGEKPDRAMQQLLDEIGAPKKGGIIERVFAFITSWKPNK